VKEWRWKECRVGAWGKFESRQNGLRVLAASCRVGCNASEAAPEVTVVSMSSK
jgi:hypothetical protein